MIIPIRCFTCGKVIASKWLAYQEMCTKQESSSSPNQDDQTYKNFDANYKGKILDSLGLTKICCRRHMLGHVDLIDHI